MDVRAGQSRRQSAEELVLSNCGAEDLESPLESMAIKPINLKGNYLNIFGRTDVEASILWPTDAKNRLIRKEPNAGKGRRQEEKGMTDDEMVGWHHRLNGR